MTNKRSARTRDAIGSRLWPLPALAVTLAMALGILLPVLDASVEDDLPRTVAGLLFGGGPEAARSVLQAVSGSLITVTSLTFSLTVVTLQLASSQYSPRLLRTFSRDRTVHVTLALFLGTFTFALTVLRTVRTGEDECGSFVPAISITVAFALAITSVMALVLFLAHLTREIRIETIIRKVNSETTATLERVFSADRSVQPPEPPPSAGRIRIEAAASGFLTALDEEDLLQAALDTGTVVRIDCQPGNSLIRGIPFATAWPLEPGTALPAQKTEHLRRKVNAAAATGFERTPVQDVGFGFRQLADVAARALSPAVNDPTTAVHVLGHLSDLLCRVIDRQPGPQVLTDEQGRARVVLALPRFEDLLDLAVAQPRLYGVQDPAVAERILQLLGEVSRRDSAGRYRQAITEQVEQIREAINTTTYTRTERRRLLEQLDRTAQSIPPH
jgi:uncharacterized membrane protein